MDITRLSLGERPHDPTNCHQQGLPHLGPCCQLPTTTAAIDLRGGSFDDLPISYTEDVIWLSLVHCRPTEPGDDAVTIVTRERGLIRLWPDTVIRVGKPNARVTVEIIENVWGEDGNTPHANPLPAYGWHAILPDSIDATDRYADMIAGRVLVRRSGGDGVRVTVTCQGRTLSVYHGGPAGGVTGGGVSLRTMPDVLLLQPWDGGRWEFDGYQIAGATDHAGATAAAEDVIRELCNDGVSHWTHHRDRYGEWWTPVLDPPAEVTPFALVVEDEVLQLFRDVATITDRAGMTVEDAAGGLWWKGRQAS
jgi:hypothetical protein